MRIVAYVMGGIVGAVGWFAVLFALIAVSPWLGLAWVFPLAIALVAAWATSPAYWGDHGRRGPRARQDGRRAPGGSTPTPRPPRV